MIEQGLVDEMRYILSFKEGGKRQPTKKSKNVMICLYIFIYLSPFHTRKGV
jgi:hypothetical protein